MLEIDYMPLNPDAPIVLSKGYQSAFDNSELIECGKGELFGSGNAQLPLPPMLMFDRVTQISSSSGKYNRGVVKAELDVRSDLWFIG